MKGISQFIAAVLLIVLVVAVSGFLMAWSTGLMRVQASDIGGEIEQTLDCRKAGIRMLDDTLKCNFTGNDYFNFSIQNTGYINIYDLKVQMYVNGVVYTYDILEIDTGVAYTKDYPLKIGEIKSVYVNLTDDLPTGMVDWIRITTNCPEISDRIENISC